ncbi:MAG: signal peptidase I [Bdellovibrionales bacterium]
MFGSKKLKKKKSAKEEAKSIGFAILIALTIRWCLFEAYVIPSGSMLPSLLIRDHIFVNKFVYGVRVPFTKKYIVEFNQPQRGEVIIFKFPKDESIFYVKRLIGMPGDEIEYDDGILKINGQVVQQTSAKDSWDFDWVTSEALRMDRNEFNHMTETLDNGKSYSTLVMKMIPPMGAGPIVVPEDHYFAMGDNRNGSHDSRGWGFVPKENIIGRASLVWLTCDETLPILTFLCNPLEIRWGRMFHSIN